MDPMDLEPIMEAPDTKGVDSDESSVGLKTGNNVDEEQKEQHLDADKNDDENGNENENEDVPFKTY